MAPLHLTLLLALGVAASVCVFAVGHQAIRGARDRILTGRTNEGVPLSVEHRWLMYRNDWMPLTLGSALVSLTLAVLLVYLPELGEDPGALRVAARLGALVPLVGFTFTTRQALDDRRALRKALGTAPRRER